MRITNSMMVTNTVWNINNNAERLNTAQQQMSSQSKIQLPSDDPIVATRAIKYRNYVATGGQYQKNIDDAASWQQVTDGALGSLGDIVKQVRDLTVQAANGTLNDSDKQDISAEVSQLEQEAVNVLNTSYAGRYVFGGFATDKPPYELTSTAAGDKVLFKGQYLSLGGPAASSVSAANLSTFVDDNAGQMYTNTGPQAIKYNIGFGSQIAVNVEGQDVTGTVTGANLFDTFSKLLIGLGGDTSYQTAQVSGSPPAATVTTTNFSLSDVLGDLDNDYNRLLTVRADLGARMNYVNMTKDRLGNDNTTYTKLMSNNEDVDVAQASTNVSTAQYVYQASLSVGAKVMTNTLVDYLK